MSLSVFVTGKHTTALKLMPELHSPIPTRARLFHYPLTRECLKMELQHTL